MAEHNMIRRLLGVSLYRNAFFLIMNQVVLSGFGFLFWAIVVRIYAVRDVGLASALISSLEFISMLSLIGFDIALIKYMPKADRKSTLSSSCFFLSAFIAILISSIFVIGLGLFSRELMFLQDSVILSASYIILVSFYPIFTLVDGVFIALRKAQFVLLKNIIFSSLKLVLPFLLVFMGSFGVFSSMGLSALFALFFILMFMPFRLRFRFSPDVIKRMFRFSSGNYLANIFRFAPGMLLPIIITDIINPETAAYFYVGFMVAYFLFIIPTSISHSLLAEGSHDINSVKINIRRAYSFSFLVLIPLVVLIFLFGDYLLLLFGTEYSKNSFPLLKVLSVSALPFALNAIYATIKNIKHEVKVVVTINFVTAIGILLLSFILRDFGLIGIGFAWLIGQITGNLVVLYYSIRSRMAI